MPLTLPSHVAAVLPFARWSPRHLHPTALVVGVCAPDMAYMVGLSAESSHSWSGLWLFSLPLAVFVFAWAEYLVLPWAQTLAPNLFGLQLSQVLRPRSGPGGFRGILAVFAGALLGVLTHLLWDGFTHDGWWPADPLFSDATILQFPLAQALWWVSSVLGAVFVWRFLRLRFPASRGQRVRPELWAFLTVCTLCCVLTSAWAVQRGHSPRAPLHWTLLVASVNTTFLVLTFWSAVSAAMARVTPPPGAPSRGALD